MYSGKTRTGADIMPRFDDPFLMPSSETFPTELKSSFDFCLFLYYLNPLYVSTTNRVFTYFLTELEFSEYSDSDDKLGTEDQQKRLKETLEDKINIWGLLQQVGVDWGCYGNAFVKVNRPFDRYVVIPTADGDQWVVLNQLPRKQVTYDSSSMKYTVPNIFAEPDSNGELPSIEVAFEDVPSRNVERLSYTFLDPRYIVLDKPHFSDNCEIVYKLPPDVKARIKDGNLNEVNNCTALTLEAVKEGFDIRYQEGEVFHFKQPTVTGLSESGWGIPNVIAHYRDIYQCQIYRKIDEVIAKDYLMPLRILSPEFGPQTGGDGTPAKQIIFSGWKREMKKIIETRRLNKFAIHVTPTPVRYDEHGANGKQYSPKELVEIQNQVLMDGIGYPQELHRGTIQIQQTPTALRLFEKQYHWLFKGINNFTSFVSKDVQSLRGEGRMKVGIARPMMADNLETSAMFTQLAMGGEFPRADAWKRFGVEDPVKAYQRRVKEDMKFEEVSFEAQKDLAQKRESGSLAEQIAMQGQQGPPPVDPSTGAPVMAAPGAGALAESNPLDVQNQAMQLAQEWISLPQGDKNKMLAQVKATNPTLHASIKQEMENIRAQGASEGRAAVQQPQPQ